MLRVTKLEERSVVKIMQAKEIICRAKSYTNMDNCIENSNARLGTMRTKIFSENKHQTDTIMITIETPRWGSELYRPSM